MEDKFYCFKCETYKSADFFDKHPETNMPFHKCNSCFEKDLAHRRNKEKERQRKDAYKHKYGITMAEYNDMFTMQNGSCAICGIHQTHLKNKLSVDHCHSTGKVRGLLCSNCNTGLGYFKDSVVSLEKALSYIINNR